MFNDNVGAVWEVKSVDPDVEEAALGKIALQEFLSLVSDPLSRAVANLMVENWTAQDVANILILPVSEVRGRFNEVKTQLRSAYGAI